MTNPFDAPASTRNGGGPTGTLDVGLALSQGLDAMTRNFLTLFGGSIVVGFIAMFAILLCIVPIFVVGPALAWGSYRAYLDSVDGQVEFGTFFKGFDRLSDAVVNFLLYFVVMLGVTIPTIVVGFMLGLLDDGSSVAITLAIQAISTFFNLCYAAAVTSRFLLAPFLMVDRNLGAIDAVSRSFEATGPVWGSVAILTFACSILPLLGLAACIVGVIPAAFVASLAQAAAYRQVVGRA